MRRPRNLLAIVATGLVMTACGSGQPQVSDAPATDSAAESAAGSAADGEILDVAFVHVGQIGDSGWSARHEAGREHLEATLGARVRTTVVDAVPEGADSEAVFDRLAAEGHELIFGTSYGYGDAMVAVSARYPEVAFAHASGAETTDNLGTYAGATEQTRYLEGMAAGAATSTGQLGFVAAFPIPDVVRDINAYTLGAQSVRPDARVQVAWTSTWFDPDVETQAAQGLIDAGADVIGMHQSSPATGEVAAAAGAAWTGFATDMSAAAPEVWLTGTVFDWGSYYVSVAESVLDGTWEAAAYVGDLSEGVIDLAPFGVSVDDATRDQITTRRQELVDGSFAVFTGPIVDASGTPRVGEGEILDRQASRSMDWFVEGVLDEAA